MAIEQHDSVTLSFEGPRTQRRATVAFRFILAIPHFFWLMLVSIAVFFAVIGIWIGALFTARVPMALAEFVARALQYMTRVYSYGYLLMTDRYPSFSLGNEQPPYPVELEIDEPPRMNRAAVLFRIFLMIPAGIVVQLVGGGVAVAIFFIWLITLISGRQPDSVHSAFAAYLRYQQRFYAYGSMLTSEYPRRLFGDEQEAIALDADTFPSALPEDPRLTRIVLPKASKRLLVAFIVLGVIFNGVSGRLSTFDSSTANELRDSHGDLEDAIQRFVVEAQTCASQVDPSCIQAANTRLRDALLEFKSDLIAIDVPRSAIDEEMAVDADLDEMIRLLNQLQEAADATTYMSIATQLQTAGEQFDRDYERLYRESFFGD